jgi:DNA polymerase III epsilon subunit-like protein
VFRHPSMSWSEHPIYFIDFEGCRASGVLEYGVVTLQAGRVTDTRTRLCGATGRVRAEDTAVHGLTEAAVSKAAPFAADWDYFAGLRERGPLAAHYAGVENNLLKAVWPYPRRSPDFARPGGQLVDWGPWIDSARLYAQFYPEMDSGRLEALVVSAGLQEKLDGIAAVHCPPERRSYHGALYDALGSALLVAALSENPTCAGMSLGQMLAFSTLDPTKRDRLTQSELW